MPCINVAKLKGKMAEKGYTITSMSSALKIDRNTLSTYLKAPGKMPYSVVSRMTEILCCSEEEAKNIFFTSYLR